MNFRYDINGLRAIAVIAVVLFHFKPEWLPGGFAGVDVFFVISGFLMTGIIFRGLEQENFSILKFYVARANRIIPALAFLCLTLLVFGWFYLTPLDYRTLGKHIASSMGFLSNVIYWRESGYFDAISHEKWLLHTWSLSVEWQFYIIYPIVLIALKRFISLENLKRFVVIGTVLGFVLSVVATMKWPSSSYYLLSTRAWEMMTGSIAFLYPWNLSKNKKKLTEIVGLVLILVSYVFVSSEVLWPGHFALVPVFGTYLLIVGDQQSSVITNNKIFQYLGKWSYSIYLWHWPLVVAIYFYNLNNYFVYLGIILSIFFGFISNKYIENIKFRKNFTTPTQYLKCKPIHYMILIGCLGFAVFINHGVYNRFNNELTLKYKKAAEAIGDKSYPKPNLKIANTNIRFIKGNSNLNILFIGASHIEQTYPYVKSFQSKYNIYYVTAGGCFVSPSYVNPKWSCSNIQNYKEIMNNINFDKVVTSIYNLDGYLPNNENLRKEKLNLRTSEYDDFLRFAKSKSNQVYMILGEPKGIEFDPRMSIRHNLDNYITVENILKKYTAHYSALEQLNEKTNVKIIDPIENLCSDICSVMDEHSNFYYKDDNHMRPWYAKKNLHYLDQIID